MVIVTPRLVGNHGPALPWPLAFNVQGRKTLEEGLEQAWKDINMTGALEVWLLIFDRSENKPWNEKNSWETKVYKTMAIHNW
ncbi:MAG: hypothetical protein LBP92_00295 [Deltaproteobacteria bacterium]|nr:hypothetical protein [Deltaproteobacteria bacterium]